MTFSVLGLLSLLLFVNVPDKGSFADMTHSVIRRTMVGFCWFSFFICLSRCVHVVSENRWPVGWALLAAALLGLLVWPRSSIEKYLLATGRVQATYYASLAFLWSHNGRREYSLLLASLALLRLPKDRDTQTDALFLTRRLTRKTVRPSAVLAWAVVQTRTRGLSVSAPLLRALDSVDPSAQTTLTEQTRRDLFLLAALERGDWPQVSLRATSQTPLALFLGACARIFVATEENPQTGPSSDRLDSLWLGTEQEPELYGLYAQARKHGSRFEVPAPAANNMSEQADIETALRELACLLREPRCKDAAQLRVLGRIWDKVLAGPDLERRLAARALALGIPGGERRIKETLRTQVAEVLRHVLGTNLLPLRLLFPDGHIPEKGVLAEAVSAVRNELFSRFETLMSKLEERTGEKRALPALDEWQEWAQARDAYDQIEVFGGMDSRRLAWSAMHRPANNWACWLWNERSEKVLANAVFRFVLREAQELGDDRTAQLAQKNVGSGL